METKRVLSMAAVLFLASVVSPGLQAATMTVTANALDVVAGGDGSCSLREAIIAANANVLNTDCPNSGGGFGTDIINLPAGTYTIALPAGCENANAGGDYDINGALTISGAGAGSTIVDGGDIDRVFHITSAVTVTINDMTIRNGTSQVQQTVCIPGDDGGDILTASSSVLNLTNVIVEQGLGDEGGGVYNNNGTVNVLRSTIRDNIARLDGGGLGNGLATTMTVTDSTISNNQAGQSGGSEGNGGGIANDPGSQLTVIDSTISENRAFGSDVGGNGGGISIAASTIAGVRLRNVTITNNTSDADGADFGDGGGIWIESPAGTPSPARLTTRNTIIAGNLDGNAGGGNPDCFRTGSFASITSEGYNLVGDETGCAGFFAATGDQVGTGASPLNPRLGPLADHGGPTQTHDLLLTPVVSPAIDAGNDVQGCTSDLGQTVVLTADQRASTRPVDGGPAGPSPARCDIGAFELGGCGDGFLDPANEECEDSNTTNGDGCSATCQIEVCGDGVLQGLEACDDGNTVNGDGCSATCTNEVLPACGDGILQSGEECDDGNTVSGDGCSATCQTEVENICNDGIDNEGDGPIDCDDSDCAGSPDCVETLCSDDIDNDGDGPIDCDDSDCAESPDCVESLCADGIDNDGDGPVDCADSDCSGNPVCSNLIFVLGDGGCSLVRGPSF